MVDITFEYQTWASRAVAFNVDGEVIGYVYNITFDEFKTMGRSALIANIEIVGD